MGWKSALSLENLRKENMSSRRNQPWFQICRPLAPECPGPPRCLEMEAWLCHPHSRPPQATVESEALKTHLLGTGALRCAQHWVLMASAGAQVSPHEVSAVRLGVVHLLVALLYNNPRIRNKRTPRACYPFKGRKGQKDCGQQCWWKLSGTTALYLSVTMLKEFIKHLHSSEANPTSPAQSVFFF